MKLLRVEVENWRCYKDPFSVEFEDFTAIIGKNDIGKSAILDALDVFFGNGKIDRNDASRTGDRDNLKITCEFGNLPSSLVLDATNPSSLSQEHLLNSRGNLEICKKYSGNAVNPKITGIFARANHPTEPQYDDLLSLKIAELRARAEAVGANLQNVNNSKKADIRKAIWDHCDDPKLEMVNVDLQKDVGKDIWDELSNYLPTYWLFRSDRASTDQDSEAQDPMNAAIKEAIAKVTQELDDISTRVANEVQKVADLTLSKLAEMDAGLATTLNPIVTPKKWESLFSTSITGDEDIPLNKRGSGVRRLVLLNFFRAKVEIQSASSESSSVIYAIEEPETSQHPKNQRVLLSTLGQLTADGTTQVVITTHTPMLARSIPEKSLRFIHDNGPQRALANGGGELNENIAKALGVLPDHDLRLFWGVEGPNDIAFLKNISRIVRMIDGDAIDLEASELDGSLIFIPTGGSTLAVWADRLAAINRPEIYICDRDNQPPEPAHYQEFIDQVNVRENCKGIITARAEMENYVHPAAIVQAYADHNIEINLPESFDAFDDVPELVAMAVHNSCGDCAWNELEEDKRRKKKSRAKFAINSQAIARMTPEQLTQVDPDGEILSWFSEAKELWQLAGLD